MGINSPAIGYTHLWAELCAAMVDDPNCPISGVSFSKYKDAGFVFDLTVFTFEDNRTKLHVAVDRRSLAEWFKKPIMRQEQGRRVADYYEVCLANLYENDWLRDFWPEARTWIRQWEISFGIVRANYRTHAELGKRRLKARG